MKVKVYITYSDGQYSMEAYTDSHQEAGLHFVEVAPRVWRAWQKHVLDCRDWHQRLQVLDNELYDKEHPEENE